MPAAPFDRHREVRRRALREHARDRRRVQQQLASRHTAAARLGQQDLGDHASQVVGQRELHVTTVLWGVEIDDAIDRLGRIVRREAADDEVP